MTLDELKAELAAEIAKNPALGAWVDQYGSAFLAMAEADLLKWVQLIATGQTLAAWQALLAAMTSDDLLNAWNQSNQAWATANAQTAAEIQMARTAIASLLEILLPIALAAAGF